MDAGAGRVELEAVIRALHAIAFMAPLRQRREAMRTAVEQRMDDAGRIAKEHQGLVQQRTPEQVGLAHLMVPGCDIPTISQERHTILLVT
jgi:hypothetical protein